MENEIFEEIENTENNEIESIEQIEPPKPVYIYNYGIKEKEYLFKEIASQDYEESKKQNKFVALVPAYATLTPPPEYNEYNEIPVMQDGEWVIKPDYRKNFYSVNEHWLIEEIRTIGELAEGLYLVTKEVGEKIKENFQKFKIENGEIVELTETEYNEFLEEREAERIAMLNLTRGDVFRGLLLAKGITKNQIAQMIEAMPVSTQEEIVTKELALIDFEDALNFYRGNQLIDTIGLALGITSKQLDKFFEAGTSDDTEIKADAYKYLTTVTFTINSIPVEAVVTINSEAKNTVTVPYGATAHYKVELEGYKPYTGSIELLKDTELDIELEKIEEVENEDTTDTES